MLSLHALLVPFFVEFGGLPFRLTTTDLVGGLVLLVWVFTLRQRGPGLLAHRLFWPTVVFAGIHVVAVAAAREWAPALRESLKVVGILVFLLGALTVIRGAPERRLIAWALLAGGTLVSLLSLPESGRIAGTLGNANTLAAVLSVIIPVGVGLLLAGWQARRWLSVVLSVPAVVIMTVALAMTLSRGAWLGLLAGLLVVLAAGIGHRTTRVAFIAIILLFALCFVAVDAVLAYQASKAADKSLVAMVGRGPISQRVQTFLSPTRSDQTRLHLVQAAWEMYRDHPLLGIGPGHFDLYLPDYPPPTGRWRVLHEFPHSFPVHVAAETGTLGLVAFLWWVGALLVSGFQQLRAAIASGGDWAVRAGAYAGVMAALVGALFGYPFVHGTWEPFIYAIALACAPGERPES